MDTSAISANAAPDVNRNPNFAAQLATRNVWTDIDQVVPANEQAAYLPKIWKANSNCGTATKNLMCSARAPLSLPAEFPNEPALLERPRLAGCSEHIDLDSFRRALSDPLDV